MNMRAIRALFSGLVVPMFFFGVVLVGPVHAQQIVVSDSDVRAQGIVVQEKIMGTLEEYVKYLQLVLINQLEARLALLKARATAR